MAAIVSPGPKSAAIPVTISPMGLQCAAQVLLTSDEAGTRLAGQSDVTSFTSKGVLQTVNARITIPSAGAYYVFVAVYISGIFVGVWSNPSIIVTPYAPPITFGTLGAYMVLDPYGYAVPVIQCKLSNNTATPITNRLVVLHSEYISKSGTLVTGMKQDCSIVNIQPGGSVTINFTGSEGLVVKDAINTVWLEDAETGFISIKASNISLGNIPGPFYIPQPVRTVPADALWLLIDDEGKVGGYWSADGKAVLDWTVGWDISEWQATHPGQS